MAVKGVSALTWTATPKGIKISNMSGKSPNVPMAGRGVMMKVEGRETSGVLKQSLAQSAHNGMPRLSHRAIK
jgi:hypothetical protein